LTEALQELPQRDCQLCPRLAAFRAVQRQAHPDWFNAPVPSFGDASPELLIVGLAPGLRGANRTGRPFTGDYAGDLLYRSLLKFGLAGGAYGANAADGLELRGVRITNAVRCVPPENKPVGAEIAACRPFLTGTLDALPRLRAVVALGRIAHESTLRALARRQDDHRFAHNARHDMGRIALFDSYHCSRYNTSTRRLTPEMFRDVFASVRTFLDGQPA
jgi:uracil-DNA glycosylase